MGTLYDYTQLATGEYEEGANDYYGGGQTSGYDSVFGQPQQEESPQQNQDDYYGRHSSDPSFGTQWSHPGGLGDRYAGNDLRFPTSGGSWGGSYMGTAVNKAAEAAKAVGTTSPSGYGSRGGLSSAPPPQQPGYVMNVSKTVFPQGFKAPTFAGPKWDEGEIRKRARRIAAPQSRRLEMQIQQAMNQYYENPNVRRMVLRDTMAGYGLGLSGITAQSYQAGLQEYAADYSRQYTEAITAYQQAWQSAMAQATRITTSYPVEDQSQYESILKGTTNPFGTLKA